MRTVDQANPAARRTRRTFLLGLAGAAGLTGLAGCGWFGGENSPVSHELDGFLAATLTLADRYDATLSTHTGLETTLGAIRDAHHAHATALAEALGRDTPPSATPTPATPAEAPPASRTDAVAALATAEKKAYREAVDACLATTPRLAILVGTIAAARATHLEVLT